jgi:nucleotide-binding universal stress UspA family protein
MRTIVVATDGSVGACRAHRWARALAEMAGAEVVDVAAWGAPRVLAAADAAEADLVVVPAHPHSVVGYVARHSRRPFAVVPAAEWGPPSRIAVGDDGSPGAAQAARWSAALAALTRADIVAIDVVHPPEFLTPYLPELHDDAVQEVEEHWAAQGAAAVRADVVDDAHPGTALLREAAAARADLLVLGARALYGVRLLPATGVTMTALHHSRVPVVVVPAEAPVWTARDGGSEEGYTVQRVRC